MQHGCCRRCCCAEHLCAQFLFDTAEADFRGGESDINAVDRLIVTSGKMVLLDKLLRRLKDTGHRCMVHPDIVLCTWQHCLMYLS